MECNITFDKGKRAAQVRCCKRFPPSPVSKKFSLRSCRSSSLNFFLIFRREIWEIWWEIWRDFRGIFLTLGHRIKAQKFQGIFRSIFIRKFVAQKNIFRAKFTLQMCHLNLKSPNKNRHVETSCKRMQLSPRLMRVLTIYRGFRKGWLSKRVALAEVPPERKPERGYIRMFPRNENRNEGTFGCSRRRTNVQQLTCNIDLSNSFYY